MKIMIDWEDVDLTEILKEAHGNFEDEDGRPRSVGEMLIDKYLECEPNFHILNTNFNLSAYRCRRIADVPGIERFTPLSRYRAMVNIGKLFDVDATKRLVLATVNKFFYSKRLQLNRRQPKDGGV